MKKSTSLLACALGTSLALQAQQPFTEMFCPIDTAWTGKTIVIPPSPLHYDILLKENDIAYNLEKGSNAPLKGGFGTVYYHNTGGSPSGTIGSIMSYSYATEGWLYLTLQDNKNSATGDGGGLVRAKVGRNSSGSWAIIPQSENGTAYNARSFDLDALGKGKDNNGIMLGKKSGLSGNFFMYDGWAASNNDIASGITDLSNYTLPAGSPQPGLSIPRYQNTGWLTEISRSSGKPIYKLYHAGRGDFGGLWVSSDMGTGDRSVNITAVYATQTQPAVLLKYEGNPYQSKHEIYAFQQDAGAYTGKWILLNDMDVDGSLFPFTFTELLDVQKIALQKGATMFNKLGGIAGNIQEFYIAETGGDSYGTAFTDPNTKYNGQLAYHLEQRGSGGTFADPYGRILKFSTASNNLIVEPYLEGGITADMRYTFSNPKQLTIAGFTYNSLSQTGPSQGTGYLVISEAAPDNQYSRNPPAAVTAEELMQEIYFLDIKKANPDLSDLRPFSIAPRGAEVQTSFASNTEWSPLFVSLRYPNTANDQPYAQSLVIAVSNFEEYFANPQGCNWVAPPPGTGTAVSGPDAIVQDDFKVWPNPATRTLYFGKEENVQLYDVNGRRVKERRQVKELNILDLVPGVYFIRNGEGHSRKIIIQ